MTPARPSRPHPAPPRPSARKTLVGSRTPVRLAESGRSARGTRFGSRNPIRLAESGRSAREIWFGSLDPRILASRTDSREPRRPAQPACHAARSRAPTRRDDAAAVAVEIRERLDAKDKYRALRALIQLDDNLVAEHGLVRGILGLAEPEKTKDPAWDAAIAALMEWRLREEGLPSPDWVAAPGRFLSSPRTLDVDVADPVLPTSQVPDEFARRGVLIWRDTFASV